MIYLLKYNSHKQSTLSTKLRMVLALLTCGRSGGNSSSIHKPFMGSDSSEEIRFGVEIVFIPDSFSKGTGSYPDFHMMSVPVIYLTPKTNFSTQHVILIFIALNVSMNMLIVQVQPGQVTAIIDTIVISNSHVQIKWSIV